MQSSLSSPFAIRRQRIRGRKEKRINELAATLRSQKGEAVAATEEVEGCKVLGKVLATTLLATGANNHTRGVMKDDATTDTRTRGS